MTLFACLNLHSTFAQQDLTCCCQASSSCIQQLKPVLDSEHQTHVLYCSQLLASVPSNVEKRNILFRYTCRCRLCKALHSRHADKMPNWNIVGCRLSFTQCKLRDTGGQQQRQRQAAAKGLRDRGRAAGRGQKLKQPCWMTMTTMV